LEMHMLVPDGQLRPAWVRLYRRLLKKDLNGPAQRPPASHIEELVNSHGKAVTVHRLAPDRYALARTARRLSLDVLVPSHNALPADFPTPWVGYIADFQHRYLAHLFSEHERRSRDAHFSAMLGRAKTIIVNSRAAAKDALRFHPEGTSKIFHLPFSAAPQSHWLAAPTHVAEKFGVHGRYFLISNQFWKHKDHLTAFAAFASVANVHPEIHLVCTGATEDYRDPHYFSALKEFLRDRNIAQRVHILGMIPKLEQIELMKSSVALVQPTLFEGGPGGGAVYDAVSLGIPCLVSDIDVNRELDEPLVDFFAAGDAASLAAQMQKIVGQPRRLLADADSLRQRGAERRAACGRVLLESIECARSI